MKIIFLRFRGGGAGMARGPSGGSERGQLESVVESQWAANSRERRKPAVKLTLRISSHFSSGKAAAGERCWMPPLCTRMSTSWPSCLHTRSTIDRMSARLAKSQL